jgi:hypothetical protein
MPVPGGLVRTQLPETSVISSYVWLTEQPLTADLESLIAPLFKPHISAWINFKPLT